MTRAGSVPPNTDDMSDHLGGVGDDRVWRAIACVPADPWEAAEIAASIPTPTPLRANWNAAGWLAAAFLAALLLGLPTGLQRPEPPLRLGALILLPAPEVTKAESVAEVASAAAVGPQSAGLQQQNLETALPRDVFNASASAPEDSPELELPAIALAQNPPPDLQALIQPQPPRGSGEITPAAATVAPVQPPSPLPASVNETVNLASQPLYKAAGGPTATAAKEPDDDEPPPQRPSRPAKPEPRKAPARPSPAPQESAKPRGDAVRSFFFENGH